MSMNTYVNDIEKALTSCSLTRTKNDPSLKCIKTLSACSRVVSKKKWSEKLLQHAVLESFICDEKL